MNLFRIPIGDWSGDGHSECDYYLVGSNKTVEEVREIYFDTVTRLGVGLDGTSTNYYAICCKYQDSTIELEDIERLGLNPSNHTELIGDSKYKTEEFLKLVIDFLTTHNEGLIIEPVTSVTNPMLPFYGYDEKKRHIGYFGYGLFD